MKSRNVLIRTYVEIVSFRFIPTFFKFVFSNKKLICVKFKLRKHVSRRVNNVEKHKFSI